MNSFTKKKKITAGIYSYKIFIFFKQTRGVVGLYMCVLSFRLKLFCCIIIISIRIIRMRIHHAYRRERVNSLYRRRRGVCKSCDSSEFLVSALNLSPDILDLNIMG